MNLFTSPLTWAAHANVSVGFLFPFLFTTFFVFQAFSYFPTQTFSKQCLAIKGVKLAAMTFIHELMVNTQNFNVCKDIGSKGTTLLQGHCQESLTSGFG